eukprot:scaffold1795_cov187-Alexandrium_tamarense.AAC.38
MKRTSSLTVVVCGLIAVHLEAFSTTLSLALRSDVHRVDTKCRFANRDEEIAPSSSTLSRRGFIGSCAVITGAAVCNVVSTSPASALDNKQQSQSTSNQQTTTPITQSTETSATALQESISGFFSGTAVSAVKTLVKYPLDTATVRLQMPDTKYTLQNLPMLFDGSMSGIAAPLLSNIPAGAIFFAVKDAIKSSLKQSDLGLPTWMLTSLAVAAALPPYWLIRNPSEVIKTRLQVGSDGYYEGMSTIDAFKLALSQGSGGSDTNSTTVDGVRELYQGYPENILYGFPADIIKFVAYDYLSGGRKNLSPADGAMYGAVSTAFAQWLTTPLDVLRNRIMADIEKGDEVDDLSYVERLTKIAREEGVDELFAGTSPRIAKAMLSGALQFAAYEETKQKIGAFFASR